MEIRAIGTESELRILCAKVGMHYGHLKHYSVRKHRGGPIDPDRVRIYLQVPDGVLDKLEHEVLEKEVAHLSDERQGRSRL
ncbi:MAG: hypothetical protein ABW165_14475 [Candidatus Thiodiazotropha sp.]